MKQRDILKEIRAGRIQKYEHRVFDLMDRYVATFGRKDFSNVFINNDELADILDKCLSENKRFKDVVGYDERDFYDGDYM